ncbi:hypothetical protein CPB84DRAFT_1851131 [Gymnopilus junonius]|uniref:Uncharacterized protein n=1 Tax=Gymnopilus junonius TaxID=109634 RepID=A0A9P5NG29_GYMJU|nr:hypothetical protein CPB84DRAFT_1851131 [Gymnopilus junonius]
MLAQGSDIGGHRLHIENGAAPPGDGKIGPVKSQPSARAASNTVGSMWRRRSRQEMGRASSPLSCPNNHWAKETTVDAVFFPPTMGPQIRVVTGTSVVGEPGVIGGYSQLGTAPPPPLVIYPHRPKQLPVNKARTKLQQQPQHRKGTTALTSSPAQPTSSSLPMPYLLRAINPDPDPSGTPLAFGVFSLRDF